MVRAILRNPSLRRVQLAFLLFNAVEFGTRVAILLYAYQAIGPTSVGLVAVVQLVPGAVLAPFIAGLGDRIPRDRLLFLGYLAQMAAYGATWVGMALGAVPLVVVLAATCAATALSVTRPAQGSRIPSLSRTPEELTAANGLSGTMEGAGMLVGPLIAAAILAVATPTTVFGAATIGSFIAAALVVRLPSAGRPVTDVDEPRRADAADRSSLLDGLRLVARHGSTRIIVSILALRMVVIGALAVCRTSSRRRYQQRRSGADDDHPQRQDGNDDPGAAVPGDQAQPVEEAAPIGRVGSPRLVHVRHGPPGRGKPDDERRGDERSDRRRTEDGGRRRDGEDGCGDQRSDKHARTLHRAGQAVRGGQLLGCSRQAGDERALRRTGDRQRGRCARRGQDDHEGHCTKRHPDPRRTVGRHLRQVAQEQETITRDAISEPRDKWRQHGARNQLDDRHQPDARRADGLIGVQQDRDPRPEFDRVEEEEGEAARAEATGCAGSPGPP